MNNWNDQVAKELKDSPVGVILKRVLEEYHNILSEVALWIIGQSVDGNIVIATRDILEDGYHLYVNYNEYDTNKTFHLSVLNNGNLVIFEVNTPVDEINEVEEIEIHEFGYKTKEEGLEESYYSYHNFIDDTLLEKYSVIYDQDGLKLETENIINEKSGHCYQR